MIHLVLDTSIYRQKPRLDSPEFKTLNYLSEKECIKIHVPFFVEKEFYSYLEIEQENKLDATIRSLNSIINYQVVGMVTKNLSVQYKIYN